MWPFLMGLGAFAGSQSSIRRGFVGTNNTGRVLDTINQFLPDSQRLTASASPEQVAQAFRDLAEALNINVLSENLWRIPAVPLLMLMQLMEGVDSPASLGLYEPAFRRLHEEIEKLRIEGATDHHDFQTDLRSAAENLEILKNSRVARVIWGVFDRMTDRAWSICRPKQTERMAFLLGLLPSMGPQNEDLALRKQFVGVEELDWSAKPQGAGGVVPWVLKPSELGERKVIKEMFSYLPTRVEENEGYAFRYQSNCDAATLKESFAKIMENASKLEKKVFNELFAEHDIPTDLESIGAQVLQVLSQGSLPPRGVPSRDWQNYMLPAVIGLTKQIHPLRVFVPELKKIAVYRKRVRGQEVEAAASASKKPRV